MKKILAIAVATAIAAPAMADMTISGSVAAGYSTNSASYASADDAYALNECIAHVTDAAEYEADGCDDLAAAKSAKGQGGFGVDTATIMISGSETLENGMTVAGSMGIGGLGRSMGLGAENASLSLSGDFGTFAIGEIELGNGVFGYSAGVAEDFTGELSAAASNATTYDYTAPAMNGFTVKVGATDASTVGVGEDSPFSPYIKVSGNLTSEVSGFVQYDSYGSGDARDSRYRFAAKYDMGVATLAGAYENTSYKASGTADATNSSFGVTVPVENTTLSVAYGKADSGTATNKGTSFGLKQALSSNVAVSAKYTTWEAGTVDNTKTSLLMSVSF